MNPAAVISWFGLCSLYSIQRWAAEFTWSHFYFPGRYSRHDQQQQRDAEALVQQERNGGTEPTVQTSLRKFGHHIMRSMCLASRV